MKRLIVIMIFFSSISIVKAQNTKFSNNPGYFNLSGFSFSGISRKEQEYSFDSTIARTLLNSELVEKTELVKYGGKIKFGQVKIVNYNMEKLTEADDVYSSINNKITTDKWTFLASMEEDNKVLKFYGKNEAEKNFGVIVLVNDKANCSIVFINAVGDLLNDMPLVSLVKLSKNDSPAKLKNLMERH